MQTIANSQCQGESIPTGACADTSCRGRQAQQSPHTRLAKTQRSNETKRQVLQCDKADRHIGDTTAELSAWKEDGKSIPDSDHRIVIEISSDEHLVNDAAIGALAKDESIYQSGNRLVRVLHDEVTVDGIERPVNSPHIARVQLATLRERLSKCVRFLKPDKDGELVPAHVPDFVVKAVAARGQYPGIRRLTGVVTCPVLRPDGTMLMRPGYDNRTGLYLDPVSEIPELLDSPCRQDAMRSLDMIWDVVCDFPFACRAHRSVWLAGLLTPLARYTFRGPAPMFLMDANVRGSGKTLLTDIIGIIASGRTMCKMSNTSNDEEARKRITSLAMLGDALVCIDNVTTMGSPSLDAALTGDMWRDRELGRNRMVEAALRMTWYASGNNVVLMADTSRRICHVRLNCPDEHPEERTGFRHPDLRGYVRKHRLQLLGAALTILHAWFVAGQPRQDLTPWGSFEGWSNVVRQCIVWLGLLDPGETRAELRSRADTEDAAVRALVLGWRELDPTNRGLTAREALSIIEEHPDKYDTLCDAIGELCDLRHGKSATRSLGNKLRRLADRTVDGKRITRTTGEPIARWRVEDSFVNS